MYRIIHFYAIITNEEVYYMSNIYLSLNMDFVERCNTVDIIASYVDSIPKCDPDELEKIIADYDLLANESMRLYSDQEESIYNRSYGIAEFALSINRSVLVDGLKTKKINVDQFQSLWLMLCDIDLHIFESLVICDYDSFNNTVTTLLASVIK